MENEIKVNEYIRTKGGQIHYIDKLCGHYENGELIYNKQIVCWDGKITGCTISELQDIIVKHSSNLIDLIQCGDYVNGKEVKHIADFEGINKPIKKLIFVDKKHLIPGETAENEDIETVVTKEQFESISYKVTKM